MKKNIIKSLRHVFTAVSAAFILSAPAFADTQAQEAILPEGKKIVLDEKGGGYVLQASPLTEDIVRTAGLSGHFDFERDERSRARSGGDRWFKDGKLNRGDCPAAIYSDGTKEWYRDGKLHNDDGPAVKAADGTKEWWRNGLRHRDDGPAVETHDGTKIWYRQGLRHREDGPAYISSEGATSWYRNGKLHREGGPALEYPDGEKAWFLDGERQPAPVPPALAVAPKPPQP